MLTPARMEQLNVVVLDNDIEAVTKTIVELGMVHLISIDEVQPWARQLQFISTEHVSFRYNALLKRLRLVAQKLHIDLKTELVTAVSEQTVAGLEEIEKNLNKIELDINPLLVSVETQEADLRTQEHILNQVNNFGPLEINTLEQYKHTYIEVVIGQVNQANFQTIKNNLLPIPHVLLPFQTDAGSIKLLIIGLKKDKPVIDKAVQEGSLEIITIPEEASAINGDVRNELRKRIQDREIKIVENKNKLNEFKSEYNVLILNYLRVLQTKQLILRARNYFKKTARTYLMSGWIPRAKRKMLIDAIQEVSAGRCCFEELDPEGIATVREGKIEVPVQFDNPSFLKPFEFLTGIFGLPRYNTIDPTVFVAFTYFIMFGAMFGDVGHGLVLGIIGLFLLRRKKIEFIKIGGLLIYCGLAAMIFGVLYGSYFGVESLFPPLWMHPLHDIMGFLVFAIIWGVAVISIGIIINIVNAVKTHNPVSGIFGKAGLLSGFIYWGVIGLACIKFMGNDVTLSSGLVIGVIGTPIIVLLLKGPLIKIFRPQEKMFPEGVFAYILDTVMELVEIFIGYLANTVSFVRVAAFALAHVGLFIAVFSLADILRNTTGGIFSAAIVLFLGNILIIGLEGLIVAIQGLRLEYYEFFSKFFVSGGEEYKPIGINK